METLITTEVEGKGDGAAEAAGELLRMRQSQASAAREAGSDVGTVVSKAKRAASSLWLLLHAQVSIVDVSIVYYVVGVAVMVCLPCSVARLANDDASLPR